MCKMYTIHTTISISMGYVQQYCSQIATKGKISCGYKTIAGNIWPIPVTFNGVIARSSDDCNLYCTGIEKIWWLEVQLIGILEVDSKLQDVSLNPYPIHVWFFFYYCNCDLFPLFLSHQIAISQVRTWKEFCLPGCWQTKLQEAQITACFSLNRHLG